MVEATLLGRVTIDLQTEPLMVWEGIKKRGRKCVEVYSQLLQRGYQLPAVNVFLRERTYHLTGYVGEMNLFEFGGHHRVLGHLIAKLPLIAKLWDGPGRKPDGVPWTADYYPLQEIRLTEERCKCGDYPFWDYVKRSDAQAIANNLGIQLRYDQRFSDD